MKKHQKNSKSIINKRARFDYDLSDTLTAGLILTGAETKSIRMGHAILKGSFITIKNGEAWLHNMQVNPLKTNQFELVESKRTIPRKLLLTKKQLLELTEVKKQGKSIVPIQLLTDKKYIKLTFGIGRGRKKYDKREMIKKRDAERSNRNLV